MYQRENPTSIQKWKKKHSPNLLDVLLIPDLVDQVLEYAYELQGSCLYSISEPCISWKVILLPGNKIATASHDVAICTWDFTTGKRLSMFDSHTDQVCDLIVWGDQLVSTSYDGTARVWDVDEGVCVHVLQHPASVNGVALFEDKLVTACADGLLRVWHEKTCIETYAYLDGRFRPLSEWDGVSVHSRIILLDLKIVHDKFVVDTPLQTLIFWPKTGSMASFERADCTRPAAIARLGSEAFVTSTQHCVHVWDKQLAYSIPCVQICTLCVLYDGRVAVSCVDMQIRIFTIYSGHCQIIDVRRMDEVSHDGIEHLVQLPDGRLLGSVGTRAFRLFVWDLMTGERVTWMLYTGTITDLHVFGSRLVVCCDAPCENCECELSPDCDCGRLVVIV